MNKLNEIQNVFNRYINSKNTNILHDYRCIFQYLNQEKAKLNELQSPIEEMLVKATNHFIDKALSLNFRLADMLIERNRKLAFECGNLLNEILKASKENEPSLFEQYQELVKQTKNADDVAWLTFNRRNFDKKYIIKLKLRGEQIEQPTPNRYVYINDAINQLKTDISSKEELRNKFATLSEGLAERIKSDEAFKEKKDKQLAYSKFTDAYRELLLSFELCEADYEYNNPKYIACSEMLLNKFYCAVASCKTEDELEETKKEYRLGLAYRSEFFKNSIKDILKMLQIIDTAELPKIPITKKNVDFEEIFVSTEID